MTFKDFIYIISLVGLVLGGLLITDAPVIALVVIYLAGVAIGKLSGETSGENNVIDMLINNTEDDQVNIGVMKAKRKNLK